MTTYTLALLTLAVSLGTSVLVTAAPKGPKKPKLPEYDRSFEQADVNLDNALDVFEYARTQGPGTPMVQVRKRFLAIDVSGAFVFTIDPDTLIQTQGDPIPDGLLTKEEIQAYHALETKPVSTLTQFELADFDGDGLLTLTEFRYLVSPQVPLKNISRQFLKLDKSDDDLLTQAEFKKAKTLDL
jgi:hypothetical protein